MKLVLIVLIGAGMLRAQKGMYCGGNMVVDLGTVRASELSGVVVDRVGEALGGARVQVEKEGSDKLLIDTRADQEGRFALIGLPHGKYVLGISASGMDLSIWKVKLVWMGRRKVLRAELYVGT